MMLPDRLTAAWIATLADTQLLQVESDLHGKFFVEETDEKRRRGGSYTLLQGPEPLVTAWLRWMMVNTEARTRGLVIRRRAGMADRPTARRPRASKRPWPAIRDR